MANAESVFARCIDGLVEDTILAGLTGFGEILMALPGVYPSDVLSSIRRLGTDERVPEHVLDRIEKLVRRPPAWEEELGRNTKMPVPHPLDYAWRFGNSAVRFLWRKALLLAGTMDEIVLLGLPCMLLRGAGLCKAHTVTLVDADQTALDLAAKAAPSARVIFADLIEHRAPKVAGAVVVTDPPWYPEYMRTFLWCARRACRLGGHVLLCFPPEGTRPGVKEEWSQAREWAEALGLDLVGVDGLVLPYVTPLFERNALAAEGITNYPLEWRRADLATFVARRPSTIARPSNPRLGCRWGECVLDGVRIRVKRANERRFRAPVLQEIVPGAVLPSVSRRDERRDRIDVWSCGNRVYACAGRGVLLTVLGAMERRTDPVRAASEGTGRSLRPQEISLVREAMEQIHRLVSVEKDEIRMYYGAQSWTTGSRNCSAR